MATMMLRHASGANSVVDCTYANKQDPDLFPETLAHLEGTLGSPKLEQGYRIDHGEREDRGRRMNWRGLGRRSGR
jgi:D-apiose dehydrogenase